MKADLVNTNIRLLTKNVMMIFSRNKDYLDSFLNTLKHSAFVLNNSITEKGESFIAFPVRDYNIYSNVYRFAENHSSSYNLQRFVEYVNYLNVSHVLWMSFAELSSEEISLVESLLQLSSYKKIVVVNYIDDVSKDARILLYSLFLKLGLDDRLIIVPCLRSTDIIPNVTCQCLVEYYCKANILCSYPSFVLEEILNNNEPIPHMKPVSSYKKPASIVHPDRYTYSILTLFKMFVFYIKQKYWSVVCPSIS